MEYSQIEPRQSAFERYYAPARLPNFYFFNLFVAILLLIAVTLLLRRTWQARATSAQEYNKLRWLGYGSLGLVIGALEGAVLHPLTDGAVPKQIGDYLLTLGAAAVSFGVARYNALKHEHIIEQDFWHSLISVGQTVSGYLVAFYGFFWLLGYSVSPLATPLLILLAIFTQTPLGWSEVLADRLLLPHWLVGYRERLVVLRHEVLTTNNPQATLAQAEDTFQQVLDEVRQEELAELIFAEINYIFQYTRLYDPAVLQQSRLYRLVLVQQALQEFARAQYVQPEFLTEEEKATILRAVLGQLIKAQLVAHKSANPQTLATEEIEYLILHQQYVERLPRTQVEDVFHHAYGIIITGGVYSRHLTNARKRLAAALRNAELQARQTSTR